MQEIWYTITGPVDPNAAHQLVSWVNSQLYNPPLKKLKLFLSSNGGDADSAIRLYYYLKGLPIEVETIGFSQIDSAANIVFLSGQKRFALRGCRFFLHEGSFTIGNPTANLHAHEETLTLLKELYKRNIDILASETGKSFDDIKIALEQSTILTEIEAQDFGIVHEIIEKLPIRPPQIIQ